MTGDGIQIPAELRDRRQWVAWRYAERDGKQTKVPYRLDRPDTRASTSDPATWGTFSEAFETARKGSVDGIGYVFSPDDDFAGVDLDGAFDDGGKLDSTAGAIVSALDSYSERSVSGRGLHVLVRAKLNGGRHRGHLPSGVGLECYQQGRYFCMTGNLLHGCPTTIEARQAELDDVLARFLPSPAPAARTAVRPLELDDEQLLERARAARNGGSFDRLHRGDTAGYDSPSEADLALCGLLAFWTGPDPDRIDRLFRRSGLMREKWDTRRGETTYGAQTIARALEGRTEFYTPRRDVASEPPPEQAETDEVEPFEGYQHAQVLELEFPAERYHVDDLIPVGTVGTIAGVPETHKSFLAQAIATRCAAGEGEILGRQVQQKARVGHIWQDDSTRGEAERIKLFESVHATPADATLWWFLNPGLALPGDLDRLRATVDRYQLELVILDSFYSVVSGVDLRDQQAEQTILLLKREIADATGCTVLIVDHMPWATDTNRSRLRGYGGVHKGAAIRFGIYIDADGKKLYAEARGNNIRGFKKTPAYWDVEALELRLVDVVKVDQNELDERIVAYVLDHPGAPSKEVEDGVTGSRSSIRKALERLSTPGDAQSLAAGPGRQPHGNYWYPANHAGLASPGDLQATLGDPSPDLSQGQGSPESPLPRRGATSDGDPLDEGADSTVDSDLAGSEDAPRVRGAG